MMIIGIAGGTGSGKTTVVRKIIEALPAGSVTVVSQDSYYKDSSHLPWEERRAQNFDEPRAFDWQLLYQHLALLREGQAVDEPIYDYATCSRLKETKHIEPRRVIILEGIMALVDPTIRAILDMKVFVDADSDERLIRVLRRDVVERGRTVEDLIDRYQRIIKPMHNLHIEPTKAYADIIVPQGGSNSVAIDLLKQFIQKVLGQ
ncbi:MAG: uridine kinase [Bacteroidales bacterium]|nr:uridine kinase [Bacteroidales bacterium]MBO7379345.1 uridine kinase [Bacteroidales bacterium]MBP5214560.1 uridine kinase [Bacteroidales bacterium]